LAVSILIADPTEMTDWDYNASTKITAPLRDSLDYDAKSLILT
jgi:hypothetical protein